METKCNKIFKVWCYIKVWNLNQVCCEGLLYQVSILHFRDGSKKLHISMHPPVPIIFQNRIWGMETYATFWALVGSNILCLTLPQNSMGIRSVYSNFWRVVYSKVTEHQPCSCENLRWFCLSRDDGRWAVGGLGVIAGDPSSPEYLGDRLKIQMMLHIILRSTNWNLFLCRINLH